jgi:hypothetical protein
VGRVGGRLIAVDLDPIELDGSRLLALVPIVHRAAVEGVSLDVLAGQQAFHRAVDGRTAASERRSHFALRDPAPTKIISARAQIAKHLQVAPFQARIANSGGRDDRVPRPVAQSSHQ